MSGNIVWMFSYKPVSEDEIAAVESSLNIRFPEDYIECAKNSHGGNPSMQVYNFKGHQEAVFNSLLSLNPNENNYILDVYNDIKDRLVDDVYPFADDPFGNFICFDYRKSEGSTPTVVFWDHELAHENPEKALFPICKTFTELLCRLTEVAVSQND